MNSASPNTRRRRREFRVPGLRIVEVRVAHGAGYGVRIVWAWEGRFDRAGYEESKRLDLEEHGRQNRERFAAGGRWVPWQRGQKTATQHAVERAAAALLVGHAGLEEFYARTPRMEKLSCGPRIGAATPRADAPDAVRILTFDDAGGVAEVMADSDGRLLRVADPIAPIAPAAPEAVTAHEHPGAAPPS